MAEVFKIGRYRRGELLWITEKSRANPLMDRKVVGVVFFGVVAMVAVVTQPLLDAVWFSAVVVVLYYSVAEL